MQFHQNGFGVGDPSIEPAAQGVQPRPEEVDVLIIGCGPAGLTLAAQLAQFPEISVRIAERRAGPLEMGQADGIACRSVEMFAAFGFAEKVVKEGYWVNEVCFWRPDGDVALARADRIQDVEDDLSEMPHVILSQARVHDFFLEVMRNGARRLEPDYNRALTSVTRHDAGDYPIEAQFDCLDKQGESETIRARYIVGCDGARSQVRRSMGHALKGDSARQLWGVMDVLPRTNFPDIRLKCAIQSAEAGSIMIIPREGGYLARLYIELDAMAEGERASDRGVTAEHLISKAQEILSPFQFDVAEVAWCSAYEIGQRVCDAFDDVAPQERGQKEPRQFIAGDACHTHSPKAGQGMNVSMADTFNLGWKLASVLRGQAHPSLLDSYSEERHAKAKELIDFDRDMARLFSAKPETAAEAALFQQYFQKHGRYTAGVETCYAASRLIGGTEHQALAKGLPVGKRFHSAPVIRLCDARPMQLAHAFTADGRWRIVLFAGQGDRGTPEGAVAQCCTALGTLVARFTPVGADRDSLFDVRAVFQSGHRSLDLSQLPAMLLPDRGPYKLTDTEKAFCPGSEDIFELRGIDRGQGAMVVVRPDQFVAQVLPLSETEALHSFFEKILKPV